MRSETAIMTCAFFTLAFAQQRTTNHIGEEHAPKDNFLDGFFDKLVDKLFARGREVLLSSHQEHLDETTLGKPAAAAMPASRLPASFPSRPVPPSHLPATFSRGKILRPIPNAQDHSLAPRSSGSVAAFNGQERQGREMSVAECDTEKMVCTTEAGQPHGGNLVNTYIESEDERKKVISECSSTIELSERQACDVGLLITGGLSPLTGFMKKADYDSVVTKMRLSDSTLFGLPVVLDVSDGGLEGKKVLLKYQGTEMAVMTVEEEWQPDKDKEAADCYGTSSEEHPTVDELKNDLGKYYIGGSVQGLVKGYDAIWGKGFKTPAEVRATLPAGKQVVAFQNRNPVHKAHFELLVNAKEDVPNSVIFVHPTCGPTQPGDIDGPTRIKTYEVLQEDPFYKKWAGDDFRWSYLPYSMKMAGPREAIQHMIIRKNFGATHFIIGRDMAGTKSTKTGDDFYGPFDAQMMGEKHAEELAMKVAKYPNMVYVGENGNARGFATEQEAKDKGLEIMKLSGTKFRNALRSGEDVPDWFAFPEVVKTLQKGGDKIFIER